MCISTAEWKRPDWPPGDDVLLLHCEIFATKNTTDKLGISTWPDLSELLLLPEEARDRLDDFQDDSESMLIQMKPSPQLGELTEAIQRRMLACIQIRPTTGGVGKMILLMYTSQPNLYIGTVADDQVRLMAILQDLITTELRRWLNRFRRLA